MKEKKIKKVVVFYEDGTFQEIAGTIPQPMFSPYQIPTTPHKINQDHPWAPPYTVTCSGSTTKIYADPAHD